MKLFSIRTTSRSIGLRGLINLGPPKKMPPAQLLRKRTIHWFFLRIRYRTRTYTY
jgi:hypothetical protein